MPLDRIKAALAAWVEVLVGHRVAYSRLYPARVVAQNADGTVDLLTDDPVIRGEGQKSVRVAHGMAGVQQTLTAGQRCLLGFGGGDPDKPFVLGFDRGNAGSSLTSVNATSIIIGSPGGSLNDAARTNDLIDVGTITATVAVAPGPVTFIYTPPGSTPQAPTTTLLLDDGKITGGSTKVQIED